jgi:hypothetical protein
MRNVASSVSACVNTGICQNIDLLKKGGHGYVVGCNRRRSGKVFDYIQSATGPWIECPLGINARAAVVVPNGTLFGDGVLPAALLSIPLLNCSFSMGDRRSKQRKADLVGQRRVPDHNRR